ncbi:hypothetical protein HK103_000492 [Boothiomyces macroporosus]|uniref:MYND-type domain-containing protein n=1 Tax=Boothiomyces macroporosus TaxID=261099 RepID=A0AAD5UBC6_9FUNG|nr:hypothetical protein HK103_000492 [Boothiomyces macroporosus]
MLNSPPVDRDIYAPAKLLSTNIYTSLDEMRTYQDNHWCLIAQITNYSLTQDTIVLVLQVGTVTVEAISTQDLVQNVNSFSNLAVGNTILIMYPAIADGRIQLNLDEMFIFNSSMEHLLQDMISLKSRVCFAKDCNQTKVFACNNCKIALYCGKEHQKQEWKVHKKMCGEMAILKDVVLLFGKKQDEFKRHSFKQQTQELLHHPNECASEKSLDLLSQAKVLLDMIEINRSLEVSSANDIDEDYEIVDYEREKSNEDLALCKSANETILAELHSRLSLGKSDAVINQPLTDDILASLPLVSPKEAKIFWLIHVVQPLSYKTKYESLGWEIPPDCNEELVYCKKDNTVAVLTCVAGINPTFVGSEMIIRVLQSDQMGKFELKQALYEGKNGMATIWVKEGPFDGYDDDTLQFYQNLMN